MNEELPIRESAEIPIENNPGCLVDHVAISKVDHPQLDEISLFVNPKIRNSESRESFWILKTLTTQIPQLVQLQ